MSLSQSYKLDGFDIQSGTRTCSSNRGALASSIEAALASCKSRDDCDHGTRCIPCKMETNNECDNEGIATSCSYSSMCDTTTDTTLKTRKWHLRRNIIETDHPTLSVETQFASHD
tara:strand:- start:1633 stop:1977 length:345 start_codon:yes stop_codon:yes gene_type:complete